MIIDNTELIRTLLEFPFVPHNEGIDYFYSVQLIKRAKDFPTNAGAVPNGKSNANRSIQHFQIYSLEDYDRKVTDFVELAAFHQARAYINLNIRNSREVFGLMMQRAADRILSSDYTRLHSMYEEAVGRAPAAQGTQRRWVVDVDTHDEQEIQTVVRTIEGLRGGGGDGLGKILARVPTCAGCHLVTTPFDTSAFAARRAEYVHKNNPTVLWMNSCWSDEEDVGKPAASSPSSSAEGEDGLLAPTTSMIYANRSVRYNG